MSRGSVRQRYHHQNNLSKRDDTKVCHTLQIRHYLAHELIDPEVKTFALPAHASSDGPKQWFNTLLPEQRSTAGEDNKQEKGGFETRVSFQGEIRRTKNWMSHWILQHHVCQALHAERISNGNGRQCFKRMLVHGQTGVVVCSTNSCRWGLIRGSIRWNNG